MNLPLTLLYPFAPSISNMVEEQRADTTVIDDMLKIYIIAAFLIIIILLLTIKVIYYLLYINFSKHLLSFHPAIILPSLVLLFICLLPTEEDIRLEVTDDVLTKHASTIDSTIAQWLDDNNIPQYKLCNENAMYTVGEDLHMANYKIKDTLLCGGYKPVENFHIVDKDITIKIEDDGIYGSIH